jgi:hypothetical protein
MTASLSERLVTRLAERTGRLIPSRRSFLGGAALVGAALAVDPVGYLVRPASAYDAVCGADNTCAAGYTVFCCTINGGNNTCPPDSFVGGWWKADHSSFCGGNARYYIDCNAYRDGRYTCHCNSTTCDQRRVACNQFRYGQCNTQIPWSDTGPVLCRVVSCTPPWVQFGGTCSSSSATDNNTATHSAPCLNGSNPVGVVDRITSSGNDVTISGWAYDPDSPGTALLIVINQDGRTVLGIHASLPRPDVNAARKITGNHGFSVTFPVANGRHSFAVFARNIGGGSANPQLGSRTIVVNPGSPAVGRLEVCNPVGDSVLLRGWAFDRDRLGSPLLVAIYQDGVFLMGIHTAISRPDVNAAYRISGLNGFQVEFRPKPGAHNYKVFAINAGGGTPAETLIGNHSVIVAAHSAAASDAPQSSASGDLPYAALPYGALESVAATASGVRLVGWAHDPRRPGSPVQLAVVEDERVLHLISTGQQRSVPGGTPSAHDPVPDGARAAAAFDVTVPAGPGVHTYAVHALQPAAAAGPAAAATALGSRTVRAQRGGPIGTVDPLHRMGTQLRLTGWAYDPDRPAAELTVTVFCDGAALSTHRTGLERPDLAGTGGALGRHGFQVSLPELAGTHTYGVYAESGGVRSMIGSRTIEAGDDFHAAEVSL